MSCIIQDPKNTAKIAQYIADRLNYGFNGFGMEIPIELKEIRSTFYSSAIDEYDFNIILKALIKMNHAAYRIRYKRSCIDEINNYMPDIKSASYGKGILFPKHEGGKYVISADYYKLAKLLDFYLYQCMEGDTVNAPLFQAVMALRDNIYYFIVRNSDEWKSAKWE